MLRTLCLIGVLLAGQLCIALPAVAEVHAKSGVQEPSGPRYLRLERIIVPVIDDGAVKQHLIFVLLLELTDSAAIARALKLMPRIMDGFVRDLHILASRPGTAEAGMDLEVAKRYLLATGARILGRDMIKAVLIERTVARRVS